MGRRINKNIIIILAIGLVISGFIIVLSACSVDMLDYIEEMIVQDEIDAVVVGDAYQGGKIAYILELGDPGYNANVVHGLIAANADQSAGIVWISGGSTQSTSVPGGTGIAIGTGQVNTTNIIAQAVAAGNSNLYSYAAGICDDYTNADTGTGVYSDWYLPSRDELNKLYSDKVSISGFTDENYWGSSESSSDYAWRQLFVDGYRGSGYKYNTGRVRAVRAF